MENPKWLDNSIQFPRLLAEISACVHISDREKRDLCESMGLTWNEVCSLFDRAEVEFQKIKEELL